MSLCFSLPMSPIPEKESFEREFLSTYFLSTAFLNYYGWVSLLFSSDFILWVCKCDHFFTSFIAFNNVNFWKWLLGGMLLCQYKLRFEK
ncbi:unnamed protein product, partial [Vitis vinifera]|uniref:Uncharacterized protein n=1 Tax=Vitis vinifera TaxID=29760 RepID=D7T1H2_VITVI